jgi:hypothetical protein
MTTSTDPAIGKIQQLIDRASKDIENISLKIAYSRLTPDVRKLLDKFDLTAAAAEQPLSATQVDTALEASGLSRVKCMVVKLKLSQAGILR